MKIIDIEIIQSNDDACVFDISYETWLFKKVKTVRRCISVFNSISSWMRNEYGEIADDGNSEVKSFSSLNNIEEITSKKFFYK